MSKIIVIAVGYPNAATPTSSPFLKELVLQWRRIGVDVEVINPLPGKAYRICRKSEREAYEHFPRFRSFRWLKAIPFLKHFGYRLSDASFQKAAESCMDCSRKDVIVYSHFLNAGWIAAKIGDKYGLKSFCAFGESSLWSLSGKSMDEAQKVFRKMTGFVSVSSENSEVLLDRGFATTDNIIMLPNGVDLSRFKRLDKAACREKLNFPQEAKIGIFVGSLIERKGPLRVDRATDGISGLKMVYIGSGEQRPTSENVLFCGRVQHDEINTYLCAADFFVLPTQAEGCCNAILEAMACGLPIISSLGKFNDDVLRPSFSIRVQPDHIEQIRDAVTKMLSDDDERKKMSDLAYAEAQNYDIKIRAEKILAFMEEKTDIEKNYGEAQ